MTRQRFFLLSGICFFLGLAGWFSRLSSTEKTGAPTLVHDHRTVAKEIVFPRDRVKPKAKKRSRLRESASHTEEARHEPEVSPIERAVFSDQHGDAVFIEFSAIRNSSIVEKLMKCQGNAFASQWEQSVQALGYDWQRDIDRVALSPDAMVMSGFFENAKIPEEFGDGTTYGDGAEMYQPDPASPMRYVVVDENLLAMVKDADAAKALIDRVEGRAPVSATRYPHLMENEVYGQVSASMLSFFLANDAPLATDLTNLVDNISLRMEVDDYLSISLDVKSKDEDKALDLAKSVGGLFALARREAALAGDDELAALLEQAQVLPGTEGKFGIDLAVPEGWLLERLDCDKSGAPMNPAPDSARKGDESGQRD